MKLYKSFFFALFSFIVFLFSSFVLATLQTSSHFNLPYNADVDSPLVFSSANLGLHGPLTI